MAHPVMDDALARRMEAIVRAKVFTAAKASARLRPHRDDLRQDLLLAAVEAWPRYNPERGTPAAFLRAVTTFALATGLRRRPQRSTPPPAAYAEVDYERAEQVRRVLAGLTDEQRHLCLLLKRCSVNTAARLLGVPRRTLRDQIAEVRAAFERAGLGVTARERAPKRLTSAGRAAA